MIFSRLAAVLFLIFAMITPALPAVVADLIPAPQIQLDKPDPDRIQREIDRLKRRISSERPVDYNAVRNWMVETGNNIGAGGDLITVAYDITGHQMPKVLDKAIERYSLVFAITSCLEKQFVSGEPAGFDAAFETAKFLAGKVAGGGPIAAVSLLKYSLDTFAAAATAQIDSDFYRNYCDFLLNEHPDFKFYFDLYAQPDGTSRVAQALDRFWDDPRASGIRGFGVLVNAYKGDLENVKAAYRYKFLKEYVYTAMVGLWQDELIDAEVELMLAANKLYAAGPAERKIRIAIPDIIDRGTAKGARDLKATLIHSGKYIVAQATINGDGARFEFPAGKLIHPESLKPINRAEVRLEPINDAQLVDGGFADITVELAKAHPRIRRQVAESAISFEVTKPFYVHMAYPVKVRISGGSAKITSIRTRIIPGKPKYYHSGSLAGGRHKVQENGVFLFEKMPTGKCTFTYATRRVTKMITGAETITLEPPAAPGLEGGGAVPVKPDLASVNAQRIQALQQRKNFEQFEDDVQDAIGAVTAKMADLKEDYLERCDVAYQTILEQERLLRQQKGMDPKQRDALGRQLDAKRKSLQTTKNAALQELTDLRNRYSEAEKKITREISDEDRRIQAEYTQTRDEMYAESAKVREFEKQIQKAVREVSSELHLNGSVYKAPAEAEAAILVLEQEVAKIDDLVQLIQASVDAANTARERFQALLDAREKRRFSREHPAEDAPPILADVEQMKLMLDSLKKNAVAEKAKSAAKAVKKRHEMRKKNAAEFARLLQEVKKLGAGLPDVDLKDFNNRYQQASTRFAEILDDPKGKAKALAKLHSTVKTFLDGNDAVIGDLRNPDQEKEPAFARIEAVSRQITDMVTSGVVYAGADYYKVWEPIQSKLMTAGAVRAGSGRRLISLEKDLDAASNDLDGYRARVAAAVADVETLLAQSAETGAGKPTEVAIVLNILDQAWIKTEQMPVFRRSAYRGKISATAEALAASGALVDYAKAAQRPLVVFDSYYEAGDSSKETRLNKPIFRCSRGPAAYTSVTLKARVIGLPPGKGSLIAVDNDWWRQTCPRDKKTGQYFVNVTLTGDQMTQIRVLGTGQDNPPIEYPFFQQVAVQ